MLRVRNGVIFSVSKTPDGYNLYKVIDGKMELLEEGLATMDDVESEMEDWS